MKQYKRKCLVFLLVSSVLFTGCNQSVIQEEEEPSSPLVTLAIAQPPTQFYMLYEDSLCTTLLPRADGSIPSQGVLSMGVYSYYLSASLPQQCWGWYWDSYDDFSSFVSLTKESIYLFETDSTITTNDTLYSL